MANPPSNINIMSSAYLHIKIYLYHQKARPLHLPIYLSCFVIKPSK